MLQFQVYMCRILSDSETMSTITLDIKANDANEAYDMASPQMEGWEVTDIELVEGQTTKKKGKKK